MNVGVSEGRWAVGGTGVEVGETGVKVVGEDAAVGKTSTEKVQASSKNVLNIKPMISCNHLCCFIAFSLSAFANRMEFGELIIPERNQASELYREWL